jgi:hypothetical protein
LDHFFAGLPASPAAKCPASMRFFLKLIMRKKKERLKSHTLNMRITLQGIKSRSHDHHHYSHANTKVDELENFSKHNKTA